MQGIQRERRNKDEKIRVFNKIFVKEKMDRLKIMEVQEKQMKLHEETAI